MVTGYKLAVLTMVCPWSSTASHSHWLQTSSTDYGLSLEQFSDYGHLLLVVVVVVVTGCKQACTDYGLSLEQLLVVVTGCKLVSAAILQPVTIYR